MGQMVSVAMTQLSAKAAIDNTYMIECGGCDPRKLFKDIGIGIAYHFPMA